MAAMIAARRSSRLLAKLLAPARCAAAARPLNISATMRDAWDEDDRSFVAERRGDHRHRDEDSLNAFFSDVVGPLYRRRSLSQVLNLMDQLMETRTPMGAASRGMGYQRGWDAREDGDALYLRMDMPGLGKEQVKVSLEQNTLVIRGEGDGESGRRYRGRIDLPPEVYRVDQIRAEMRNGVLKVVVPMAKEEDEPRDAVHIQIH